MLYLDEVPPTDTHLATGPNGLIPLHDWESAAAYLNTTERHVHELVARKEIPYIKVGKLIRFETRDLHAYVAAQRVAPKDAS